MDVNAFPSFFHGEDLKIVDARGETGHSTISTWLLELHGMMTQARPLRRGARHAWLTLLVDLVAVSGL